MVNTLIPFTRDMLDLDRMVDRVFQEVAQPMRTLWSQSSNGVTRPMPIDVYATDDHAVLLASAPGLHPEDLDLTIHENTVTIRGHIPSTTPADQNQNVTWYVRELWNGEFRRSVTLPFPVDAEQVEATFENGILKVLLPKADHAKPRRIAIRNGRPQPQAIGESTSTTE